MQYGRGGRIAPDTKRHKMAHGKNHNAKTRTPPDPTLSTPPRLQLERTRLACPNAPPATTHPTPPLNLSPQTQDPHRLPQSNPINPTSHVPPRRTRTPRPSHSILRLPKYRPTPTMPPTAGNAARMPDSIASNPTPRSSKYSTQPVITPVHPAGRCGSRTRSRSETSPGGGA